MSSRLPPGFLFPPPKLPDVIQCAQSQAAGGGPILILRPPGTCTHGSLVSSWGQQIRAFATNGKVDPAGPGGVQPAHRRSRGQRLQLQAGRSGHGDAPRCKRVRRFERPDRCRHQAVAHGHTEGKGLAIEAMCQFFSSPPTKEWPVFEETPTPIILHQSWPSP